MPCLVASQSHLLGNLQGALLIGFTKPLTWVLHEADNMFQCKTDEIYQKLPNVFGLPDDILII